MAPDNLSSRTNWHELHTLSGSRTTPMIGHDIDIDDGQSGPPSRAGANTANSASYGLSIVGMRPSWNTSAITGEMDGLSVFLRQARGDTAALLANIGVRSGYAASLESHTYSMDRTGGIIKGVNVQIGVVNPRDGGEYGFVANGVKGAGLTSAFRAQATGPASWTDFFTGLNSSGEVLARITGTGSIVGSAFVASGVAPTNNAGSCTTVSKITGGNAAGAFSTTAPCASSTTIRMVFSYAAPNGWVCNLQDQTTAVGFRQTANTKTTCTITLNGATRATDSIVYSATAF